MQGAGRVGRKGPWTDPGESALHAPSSLAGCAWAPGQRL